MASSGSLSPTSKSPLTTASAKSKAAAQKQIVVPAVAKPDMAGYRTRINDYQKEVNDLHQKLVSVSRKSSF